MDSQRRKKLDELVNCGIENNATMKAAVYLGKERIEIQSVADPVLLEGEVLLKIEACSVCGTDLRTFRHGDKKLNRPEF